MMLRHTEEMKRAEETLGTPLDKTLRAALDQEGATKVAERIGVNRKTVRDWALRLKIEQRYVIVGPNGRYLAEDRI